jgi:hypothetical protein
MAKASRAVATINPKLSDACMMKGLGWTDPEIWEIARRDGVNISIEAMQKARSDVNKSDMKCTAMKAFPTVFQSQGSPLRRSLFAS